MKMSINELKRHLLCTLLIFDGTDIELVLAQQGRQTWYKQLLSPHSKNRAYSLDVFLVINFNAICLNLAIHNPTTDTGTLFSV